MTQPIDDPLTAEQTLPTDTLPTDVLAPPTGPQPGWSPISSAVTGLPDSVTAAQNPVMKTQLDVAAEAQAADQNAQRNAQLAGTVVTTGGIPQVDATGVGKKIITAAEHYLGTPYVWGGTGPGGVDCSGLVQLAYRAAGIDLPRVSFQQASSGTVVGIRSLRPGDLVGWHYPGEQQGADHIAVYLGGNKIIEAAHPGTNVRIRTLDKNEGAFGVRMGWS